MKPRPSWAGLLLCLRSNLGAVDAPNRDPICDALLLGEALHCSFRPALALVVTLGKALDVVLRRFAVIDTPDPALDPHESISVEDDEGGTRIALEVVRLHAAGGGVEDNLVALEEIPHDRQVR